MVGYEYEYRAAEPFFASEALEEEPEGIVDIGYALVQFRVTGREFVLVLCRDDERVVRVNSAAKKGSGVRESSSPVNCRNGSSQMPQ